MKKKFLAMFCVAMQAILLLGGVQTSFAGKKDKTPCHSQKIYQKGKTTDKGKTEYGKHIKRTKGNGHKRKPWQIKR